MGARKHRDFEALLDVQRVGESELVDEPEGCTAARKDDVLAAVHLLTIHRKRRGLSPEQSGPLVQVHTPAALREREPRRESCEARTHNRDARLAPHTAASHERAITPSFAAFDSRARPRSGSSGVASMRSRMPR